MANTPGTIDPKLARVLAEQSNPTAHWLLKCGLEFGPNKPVVVDGLLHFEPGAPIQASGGMGGGLRQLEHWRRVARGLGVEIRFDAEVTALRGSSEGVTGLRVAAASGSYDVAARAIILCAGGFQANSDLRRRYLGAEGARAKVTGSRHDTGEVLTMALELGAAPSGNWAEASYLPTDASAPGLESSNKGNRFSYSYGITVNSLGQRFVDEGATYRSQTLQPVALAILQQPEGIAFQLFDQQGMALIQAERYDNATPAEANTIPDLARMIDVDADELERTVDQFNHSIREEITFDPGRLDHRSTRGIHPPKSNWATAIARPPFLAYKVTGGISFTFGGLRIDHKARVLRLDGSILPGLYASGDILGLFGTGGLAYPSAAGQTRNAVFSRLAGAGAAAM